MAKRVLQKVVQAPDGELDTSKRYTSIRLFNEDGTPFSAEGGAEVTGYTGSVTAGDSVLTFENGVLKAVDPA